MSAEELRDLFERLGLWEQIRNGTFSSTVVSSNRARNPATRVEQVTYSSITTPMAGTDAPHIALSNSEGNVLHWDEEDVKLETETVAKE